jgi:hypothetical protein
MNAKLLTFFIIPISFLVSTRTGKPRQGVSAFLSMQVNFTIGVTAYNNTLRTEIMDYAIEMVTEVCEKRGLACRSHTMMETKTVASSDLMQDALSQHTAEALKVSTLNVLLFPKVFMLS